MRSLRAECAAFTPHTPHALRGAFGARRERNSRAGSNEPVPTDSSACPGPRRLASCQAPPSAGLGAGAMSRLARDKDLRAEGAVLDALAGLGAALGPRPSPQPG